VNLSEDFLEESSILQYISEKIKCFKV